LPREVYSPEDKERIIWAVFVSMEGGKSLRQASKDEGVSEATILRWIDRDETGELEKRYARARDGLLTHHTRELLEIADAAEDAAKAKLQVDTRKWIMSKLMPQKFGDKVRNEVSGPDGSPVQTVTRIERVIVDPAD
jgi:transposase